MALQGKWAILYYGILASVTGGYLPIRAKKVGLSLFHLFLFLAFIFLPFSVSQVSYTHLDMQVEPVYNGRHWGRC